MNKLKTYKIISGILMVLAVICTCGAIYALYLLTGIETFYRIMFSLLLTIGLITVLYSLLDSVKFFKKKKFIISSIFTALLGIISLIISIVIFTVYLKLSDFQKTDLKYKTSLISLEQINEIGKLKGVKIGVIKDEDDIEGYILPHELIDKYKLNKENEIIEYDDTMTLMTSLVNKEVDAIFISSNYESMFKNIEGLKENQKIYEINSYEKKYKKSEIKKEETNPDRTPTKPFTILLLGADSSDKSFNGDTIMLVSFNPETLNATMFSIPRDTYVPICSASSKKCGASSKITHSAWSGAQGVVNTVENFTGIKIDYYAKINFTGIIDLVNVLGGITVDVPMKFCESNADRLTGADYEICLEKGVQVLNGEQALALSRHRKTLPLGDFQRGQNQQLVVEGMIKQVKTLRSVSDFYKVLDTISKNIETNMSTDEILSFYNVAKSIMMKDEDVNLNITKTFLTGYDLYINDGGGSTYTFQYYKQSLDSILTAIKINLGQIEKEEIKTFSFSIKTPYEKTIIGYKYYSEPRKQLIPDFTEYSLGGAESWASAHGFTIVTTEVEKSDSSYYNGQIIGQSVWAGMLVEKAPKTITLTIVKKVDSPNIGNEDDDPDDNSDDNPIPGIPSTPDPDPDPDPDEEDNDTSGGNEGNTDNNNDETTSGEEN